MLLTTNLPFNKHSFEGLDDKGMLIITVYELYDIMLICLRLKIEMLICLRLKIEMLHSLVLCS